MFKSRGIQVVLVQIVLLSRGI